MSWESCAGSCGWRERVAAGSKTLRAISFVLFACAVTSVDAAACLGESLELAAFFSYEDLLFLRRPQSGH
jgi:hypothetical protein